MPVPLFGSCAQELQARFSAMYAVGFLVAGFIATFEPNQRPARAADSGTARASQRAERRREKAALVERKLPLARCAAAVAVEDLAHGRHGTLEAPAMAFMALALCGARGLVVANDRQLPGTSSCDTVCEFLARAPVNVSQLAVEVSVTGAEWDRIVAALDTHRCHCFVARIELHDGADAAAAKALCGATHGLAHLRSLRCAGAVVDTLLAAAGGTLRRLELRGCSTRFGDGWPAAPGTLTLAQAPQLRCVGELVSLPASVTAIDLSCLQHLTRIGGCFGVQCDGLREVRLPPSVTAIGESFLSGCHSFTAVLDLSHLTRVDSIRDGFAYDTSVPDVLLPPGVTAIGHKFLAQPVHRGRVLPASATALRRLDLSRLPRLVRVGDGFAANCRGLRDVRLPPSLTSFGRRFLDRCLCVSANDKAALLQGRDVPPQGDDDDSEDVGRGRGGLFGDDSDDSDVW
jgi:hypothetical protein